MSPALAFVATAGLSLSYVFAKYRSSNEKPFCFQGFALVTFLGVMLGAWHQEIVSLSLSCLMPHDSDHFGHTSMSPQQTEQLV